jgi:hypothetical protein
VHLAPAALDRLRRLVEGDEMRREIEVSVKGRLVEINDTQR